MRVRTFQYESPQSLEQALRILAEYRHESLLLAGGTDVVPALKYRVLRPRVLVSTRDIPGLRDEVPAEDGGLRLGALRTLRDVARSPQVRSRFPALAEAAGQVASPLIRNQATLGGNVCLDTRCWYYNQSEEWRSSRPLCLKAGGEECYVNAKENRCVALFSADTPPALIALGAQATLASARGERTVPVEALYADEGLSPLAREPDEVLTWIRIPPPPPRSGAAYIKYSPRGSIDFPVLGVAASVRLDGGREIAEARIVLTAAKAGPHRLPEAEGHLVGRALAPEPLAELSALASRTVGTLFLSDTVPYKRRLLGLMVADAVEAAVARAGNGPGRHS